MNDNTAYFHKMATYSPNQITGKYYSLIGAGGNGIGVGTNNSYCIDQTSWHTTGIWENSDECLKMYMNDPEKNRIGGWKGLQMNMTCWDVLSEIYKSEHDKKEGCERQWFLRRKVCDK